MSGLDRQIKLLKIKYGIGKRIDRLRGRTAGVDMATYTDFYRRIWSGAAERLGAEFSELSRGLWRVSRNGSSTFINNYIVQIDDPVKLNIAGNKALSHRLLREAGLSVPEHIPFTLDGLDRAERFMSETSGKFFVVKPSHGTSGGRGITTHITSREELLHAAVIASMYGDELIIESCVPGESYRLLVLDGEVIHASRRRGLRATGDGTSTVAELAEKALYSLAGARSGTSVETDRDFLATTDAQGLSLDSVPSGGKEVLLKSILKTGEYVEVRTVYTEDATGLVCPGIRDEAVRAAAVIGSHFTGVDMITTDPSVSLKKSGGAIVEINTTPGLHHHYDLKDGTGDTRLADSVLDYLLKGDSR